MRKLLNKQTISHVQMFRNYVRTKIGHGLSHMEHFIYGATYMLIGFTHLEWLYYAFGAFVFICIAFGDDSSNGGTI